MVVIGPEEKLCLCSKAYDKCVAGVVSGAGSYKPGLILAKEPEAEGRLPIALVGRAFCKVDASFAPVEIGDLLTTSDHPGTRCAPGDPQQAFGAVIGKALRPLQSGMGLIPVLVALQ